MTFLLSYAVGAMIGGVLLVAALSAILGKLTSLSTIERLAASFAVLSALSIYNAISDGSPPIYLAVSIAAVAFGSWVNLLLARRKEQKDRADTFE